MRRTVSVRPPMLAAIVMAVVALSLLVGLTVVSVAGEKIIAQRQREVAQTARDYFVAFSHSEGIGPLAEALNRRAREQAGGAFRYALFDSLGVRLGGVELEAPPLKPGFATIEIGKGRDATQYEVLVQPLAVGGDLVIYEDLTERRAFRSAIISAMGAGLAVSLVVAAAAGIGLGGMLMHRARGIADAAEKIAHGDLSARAPVGRSRDVFDQLSLSINQMLGRIEALITGMRGVTDSLSHDLRSPLTRLKGALSRALDPSLSEADRIELIEQAHGQSEEVLATLGALLDIARAESGVSRQLMAAVDLRALCLEVGELFSPLFEDAGQGFVMEVPKPVVILGHELLLRQALGNLLHNASRYAGAGATVTLSLDCNADTARLIVADTGPGVPAEHRGRVQERFVRLDEARGQPGFGLGLPIAAACAKLHGGRLVLEDNAPGLRVTLEIAADPGPLALTAKAGEESATTPPARNPVDDRHPA